LAIAVVATAVVGAACSASTEEEGAERHVTPPAEARDYCALVERFYGRLDQFVSDTQQELGGDVSDAEFDQRLVGFIRENQQLFDQLEAAAPPAIAADAAIQAAAFEQVAVQGDLTPLETPEAKAAEDRTVEYEADKCGIVVE